jgi:hypothetical protein
MAKLIATHAEITAMFSKPTSRANSKNGAEQSPKATVKAEQGRQQRRTHEQRADERNVVGEGVLEDS